MIAHRSQLAVLCAGSLVLASCGTATVTVRILGEGEDCARDFGSSTAAAKIETFLAASVALDREARDLEAQLATACRDARTSELPAEATECDALVAWLASEVDDRPSWEGAEPSCEASREQFAVCVSRCELRYRAEDVRVVIEPSTGMLSAPQASPRCRASCETLSAVTEVCSGGTDPLGRLRIVGRRAERIALAARRLIEIAPVLPEAAATVSIRAVACVSSASEDVRASETRLRATVAQVARVLEALP